MTRLLFFVKNNWAAFTLVTLAAITALSLWPLEKLPAVPGTDKIHHLIAYAFVMVPTALRRPNKWPLWGALYIAYSGAIELLQPYFNHYREWSDLAANIAGAALGLLVAEVLRLFVGGLTKEQANE